MNVTSELNPVRVITHKKKKMEKEKEMTSLLINAR